MKYRYYSGPKKRAPLLLIMISGCAAVFAGLIAINSGSVDLDETGNAAVVDFVLPVKPAVQVPEPKQQRKIVRTNRPALAPVPRIEGAFTGLSLSSPDFFIDQGNSVSQSLLGELENVVMTEDSVDTPPVPKNVQWEYPQRAKQRNIEGRLIVALHISQEGKVLTAEIIEADPPGVFDEAVLSASAGWSFVPAKYQSKPVAAWVNLPIEATLQ